MTLLKTVLGLAISVSVFAAPGDLVKIIRAPIPVTNGVFGAGVGVLNGHLVVSSPNDTVDGRPNVGSVYKFRGISGQVGLRIVNPDPDPGGLSDAFGNTLLTFDDKILIGASADRVAGVSTGSAFLVDGKRGELLLTIPNPEPNKGAAFTYGALGHLGKDLIIGSPFNPASVGTTGTGTVFVFDGETGAVILRIPMPAPGALWESVDTDTRFGRSVDAHEGKILVGAPAVDVSGVKNAGAAYLFDGRTGALLMRIPNPFPGAEELFGYPVRSIGGKIVVGCVNDDKSAAGRTLGAVHIFDGKTGAYLSTIRHPNPAQQEDIAGNATWFGVSVAEHDGFLAVSSYLEDVAGVRNAGAVYVFDFDTGQLAMSILNPQPVMNDQMGWSIAFHGGQIVNGAHYKDPGGITNAGEVYVFEGPVR